MGLQAIDQMRQQQSSLMAYFDGFYLFAVLALMIVPLTLLMRKSVAEPGVRIGGE
jgi:DHA2 family multidrug resistance protein